MKRCPQCARTHNDEVITCDCGVDLATVEPQGGMVGGGGRIGVFDVMIAPMLMPIIYILGVVIITGLGLWQLFSSSPMSLLDLSIGLLSIIIWNIFWRISCECIVVLFRVYKAVVK